MTTPMIVGSLLIGADEFVAHYVRARIGNIRNAELGPLAAFGAVRDGVLIGGVVFYRYTGHDIHFAAAADRSDWIASRGTLAALFDYPFCQLGCARVTAMTGRRNGRARDLLKRLGFREEGIHALALDGIQDAVSYGMTRPSCRWLRTSNVRYPERTACA